VTDTTETVRKLRQNGVADGGERGGMTFKAEEIPAAWCRMWSADATLAHELVADDGRQWSGVTPGLDGVVGPAATEKFVAAYQQNVGNVFRPRTLVIDGGDRIAYTWDVTRRDGTVTTGADVCVLRDGLVVDNWTLPSAQGRSELPDGPGLAAPAAEALLSREALLELTADAHPWHRERAVDVARQTVGGTWSDGNRGGIAILVIESGRIDREWALPGTRALAY
jgi:hypothetical protein